MNVLKMTFKQYEDRLRRFAHWYPSLKDWRRCTRCLLPNAIYLRTSTHHKVLSNRWRDETDLWGECRYCDFSFCLGHDLDSHKGDLSRYISTYLLKTRTLGPRRRWQDREEDYYLLTGQHKKWGQTMLKKERIGFIGSPKFVKAREKEVVRAK